MPGHTMLDHQHFRTAPLRMGPRPFLFARLGSYRGPLLRQIL